MTTEREMLIDRIAQQFYDENPAWLTGPQRREVAAQAVDGFLAWVHSDGPTCLSRYMPTTSSEDRLAFLCSFADCVSSGVPSPASARPAAVPGNEPTDQSPNA